MSAIEWTGITWNPVAGCSVISAGCTNCYAMTLAWRLAAIGMDKYKGLTRKSGKRRVWTGKVKLDETALLQPYRWRRPRLVFVNSISDLFHDAIPDDYVARVWQVTSGTPRHTYQILTKRPERMRALLSRPEFPWLPNVWLGVSVENAAVLDRIDVLRQVPAAIRFISFEPLIGSVKHADLRDIDWAIVGGESGARSRPMKEKWVRQILHLCRERDVAFFFKQWGGTNKRRTGRLLNGLRYDEIPVAKVEKAA